MTEPEQASPARQINYFHPPVSRRATPRLGVAVDVVAVVVFALLALRRGQDVNFDQIYYHFFAADQFLSGTFNDRPPQMYFGAYLNPLILLPWAIAVETLPPRGAAMFMGALYGLAFGLVRRTCVHLLVSRTSGEQAVLSISAAIFSACSAIALSELGTSLFDCLAALPILGALLLLVRPGFVPRRTLLAGGLMGGAVGLKMTNAPYLIALGLVLVTSKRIGPWRERPAAFFALGAAVGYAICGGPWALYLTLEFGSPTFPFYNNIFQSSLYPENRFEDARFKPDGVVEALAYPFYGASGTTRMSEPLLRDPRWAILLVLLILVAAVAIFNRRRRQPGADVSCRSEETPLSLPGLVAFFSLGWLIWVYTFGIARYLIPLELASGILLLALISLLRVERRGYRCGIAIACVALSLPLNRVPDWGHKPWGESWYEVDQRAFDDLPGNGLVIHYGRPASFLLAYLPPGRRGIVVSPYFLNTALQAKLDSAVRVAPQVWLLTAPPEAAEPLLRSLAMTVQAETCRPVMNAVKHATLCRLVPI